MILFVTNSLGAYCIPPCVPQGRAFVVLLPHYIIRCCFGLECVPATWLSFLSTFASSYPIKVESLEW